MTWLKDTVAASSRATSTNVTPLPVAYPTGLAAGESIFLVISGTTLGVTMTVSDAGFVQVVQRTTNSHSSLWWKIADGTESGTFTVQASDAHDITCQCASYTGGPATTTGNVHATNTLGSSSALGLLSPSLTITAPGCLVIVLGNKACNASTISGPTGFTVEGQSHDATGPLFQVWSDQIQTTAANIAADSWTIGTGDVSAARNAVIAALLPASAAVPGFSANPAATSVSTNSATFGATTDQTATLYGVAVAVGDTAPSDVQIIAGHNHAGTAAVSAANVAASVGVAASLTIGSLGTPGEWDFYFVANNANGNSLVKSVLAEFDLPSFNVAASIGSATTDGYVLSYTPESTGTVFTVALKKGSATPSAAAVRTGSPTGFISRFSKACTGGSADTLALTGLTFPVHDVHAIVNDAGGDSAVTSLTNVQKLPAAGRQYVTFGTLSGTSPFDPISPSVTSGDILDIVATTPAPNNYAVSVTSGGDVQINSAGDESRELLGFNIYDVSVGDFYFTGDATLAVDDQPPTFGGNPATAFVYFLPKNQAITPVDLNPLMDDPEGDVITYREVSAVLAAAGLGVVGNAITGNTTNVDQILAVTLGGSDPYGGETDLTGTVVIGQVTVPNCAGQTQGAAEALLSNVFLTAVEVSVPSTSAAGTVVGQVPSSGSSVDPGTVVTLQISGLNLGGALLQTEFLSDATPVPAGSVFKEGSAFNQLTGSLYVAAWPANNAVAYVAGLAHRQDGALIILPSGSGAGHIAGVAVTGRGEVCAAVSSPDVVQNGKPLLSDGTLCVSAVS